MQGLKALKELQGKIYTAEIPMGAEPVGATPVITSYDASPSALDTVDIIWKGYRKATSTLTRKNLFASYAAKDVTAGSARARIGVFYGIRELSYAETATDNTATATGTQEFTHATFDFETDGVASGDMLIVNDDGDAALVTSCVRRITDAVGAVLEVTRDFPGSPTGKQANFTILRLEPVPLYAVPGSGPVGRECVFLTVDPSAPIVDIASATANRVYPLIAPPTNSTGRADGIFYRLADLVGTGDDAATEWGYRLILYPSYSDGTGPDLDSPITSETPVIDATTPGDMYVDYRNGVVSFSTPPRAGDAINPRSYVGGPLKLWAVYVVYSDARGSVSQLVSHPVSAAIDVPSHMRYDSSRGIWSMVSGKGLNAVSPGSHARQGFEVHNTFATDFLSPSLGDNEYTPGFWWEVAPINYSRWVVSSYNGRVDQSQFVPLHFASGNSMPGLQQNPWVGVEWGGEDYLFSFDINEEKWLLNSPFILSDVFSSTTPDLQIRKSGVAHGMTDLGVETHTYSVFQPLSADGGLSILALSGSGTVTPAFDVKAYSNHMDTTQADASRAVLNLTAAKKNVTDSAALGDTDNIFAIVNGTLAKFIVKGNGDLYVKGAYANFDTEEDALACQDLAYHISGLASSVIKHNAAYFERIGVLSNGFLCFNNLVGLQLGAIGELYLCIESLCRQLGITYTDLRASVR
jgi:hypothetical protein